MFARTNYQLFYLGKTRLMAEIYII